MSEFFGKFPTISYTFDGVNYERITNLLFRTKLYDYIQNFTTIYYNYTLRDGETPPIVAEKYYGDPEAHWLVMYVNGVYDPVFDWMLSQDTFNNYIINKYGSVASAMSTIHHRSKIITTVNTDGTETTKTYVVDESDPRVDAGDSSLPYDTYENLPDLQDLNPKGTFPDGSGVNVYITKSEISCYDWENQQNEAKRDIKLIDKVYWPQIKAEFQAITNLANPRNSYIRQIKTV